MKKSPWSEQFGTKGRRAPADDGHDQDHDHGREDPLNPAIPRAPLLPRDLARMPNAALPKWSNPPEDKSPGYSQNVAAAASGAEFLREHVDAEPPPGATPSTYDSAAMPPHSDSLPPETARSERPMQELAVRRTSARQQTPRAEPAPEGTTQPDLTADKSASAPRFWVLWIALIGAIALACVWLAGALD
jgi:hypothetical protein